MEEENKALQAPEDAPKDLMAMDYEGVGLPSREQFNALWHFADQMKGSIFVPNKLQGNPANVFGVMLLGKDLGLHPIQAVQTCYVGPQGQLGMEGAALIAILRNRGVKINIKQRDHEGCVIEGTRPDGDKAEGCFTIQEAEQAGLTSKSGPWKQYPRRMLFWRAVSDLFSQIGTDLIGMTIYTKEEVQEIENNSRQDYENNLRVGRMASQASELKMGKKAEELPPPEEPKVEVVKSEPEVSGDLYSKSKETVVVEAEAVEPEPSLQDEVAAIDAEPEPAKAEPEKNWAELEQAAEKAETEAKAEPEKQPEQPEQDDATKAKELYFHTVKSLVSSGSADKVAKAKLHHFVRGYLNIEPKGALPANYAEWIDALNAAIKVIGDSQGKLDNPRKTGKQAAMATKVSTADRIFSEWGWGSESIQALKDLCEEWNDPPEEMADWLTTLGVNHYSDDDAFAFLKTAIITREAYLLSELVTKSGKGAKEIMGEIYRNITEVGGSLDKAGIDKALTKATEILDGSKQPEQASLPIGG